MTCAIVLGTHRTGTSMVAGILHHLGINMGDEMLGAHPSNPLGHFEDYPFLLHNDKVVENWRAPTLHYASEKDLEIYKSMLELRNKQEFWGLKDPRLCITLKYFYGWIEDPVILCTHRDEEASARSLTHVHGMGLDKAKAIQSLYLDQRNKTLKYIKDKWGYRLMNFEYETILDDPETEIYDMAKFVGLKDYDIGEALAFVSPELRNY